jgi:hypothetical protein
MAFRNFTVDPRHKSTDMPQAHVRDADLFRDHARGPACLAARIPSHRVF